MTNNGTATLYITSITVSGDFASSAKTCGTQVLAGKRCSVTITFAPTAGGTRTGTLSFYDNAPGSPQTVALSGTGVSLKLSPTSLDFGYVAVGTTSSPQTITITNEATTVTFSSITVGGKQYLISNNTCGATLAGGVSCTVSIEFKPVIKGLSQSTLKVTSDGGGSPQTASLTGIGR